MAGDEQDDNSKVGKIVIYHINFAEQQGVKKTYSSFLFSICNRLDKGPVHLAISSPAPLTRQLCRSYPLNGNTNCNVRI